mmetsp:Transcript_122596/g.347594  ORF Transcript_122596/g.347594 Transcript_122596/m.347594 type:complete len:278 (+) Transcript_122596:583-1416(+)
MPKKLPAASADSWPSESTISAVPRSMMCKRSVDLRYSTIFLPGWNAALASFPARRVLCAVGRLASRGMRSWKISACAMHRILCTFSGPTVDRRSSRLSDTATTSVTARTVAARGMSKTTPSSPNVEPFFIRVRTTSRPSTSLMASHTPCSMMKSMSPIWPSVMMKHEGGKFQGFSFPTSRYCSAFVRMSWERSGMVLMCWRSSWRTSHTTSGGSRSMVTSVIATSVHEERASWCVRHSAPKNSPGCARSMQFTALPRSSRSAAASPSWSTTLPFWRT